MFVGDGTVLVGETTAVDSMVLVAMGVLTATVVGAGVRVSNNAPGVKKTLIQTGCVRIEGSRGSI